MLQLSLAIADNARVRALLDGRVVPQGITFTPTVLHPSEIFWRQLKFAEFDVSEMSTSSLLIATAQGDRRWLALPIFTVHRFFHTGIMVRTDRGIEQPADLRGKRVGVPEYQQTAAIWGRGILQHEFGVKPSEIEWYMERTPEKSHGGATGFVPPAGVTVKRIPPETNIGEMMVRGELDAVLHYINDRNVVDRSLVDLDLEPKVRRLFPDAQAEGRRYYAKTGLYPINHLIVVQRSIAEAHPWVPINIFEAFEASKNAMRATGIAMMQGYDDTGHVPPEVRAALQRNDPYAYGLRAYGRVIETVADYVHEQGLTDRRVSLDEIFAPSTLSL